MPATPALKFRSTRSPAAPERTRDRHGCRAEGVFHHCCGRGRGEPAALAQAEQRLKKAQGRVSRRTQQQVQRQHRDVQHTTALALVRRFDVLYLEDLQSATSAAALPHPRPGWERELSPQRGQCKGWSEYVHPRRWVVCLPSHPRLHGSMGRQASGRGPAGVHVAGLQRVW
jgi:hypothetical protein